jgi:hypothetical protein
VFILVPTTLGRQARQDKQPLIATVGTLCCSCKAVGSTPDDVKEFAIEPTLPGHHNSGLDSLCISNCAADLCLRLTSSPLSAGSLDGLLQGHFPSSLLLHVQYTRHPPGSVPYGHTALGRITDQYGRKEQRVDTR